MSAKVSMVMPCFNKAPYIGWMFDSILAQTYDNIELILVNDGSTDGTRDIIWDYADRFRDRGFEVVIIEQENKGLCSAVKTGLSHITGDFVCCVDADDLIHPEYCKAAVCIMTDRPDLDYTVCDNGDCGPDDFTVPKTSVTPEKISPALTDPWYQILCHKTVSMAVWQFMIRRSYAEKIELAEHIPEHRTACHEPDFFLPVVLSGGWYVYIDEKLYIMRVLTESHSHSADAEKSIRFFDEFFERACAEIDRLVTDSEKNKRYKSEFEAYIYADAVSRLSAEALSNSSSDYIIHRAQTAAKAIGAPVIPFENIRRSPYYFINILSQYLDDISPAVEKRPGKIFGFGVLGKQCGYYMPIYQSAGMVFDALYDGNAKSGEAVGGIPVTIPEYEKIGVQDNAIVFPINAEEIVERLSETGCNIITGEDILPFAILIARERNGRS